MAKFFRTIGLLAALSIGGWMVVKNFDVEGLDQVRVQPRDQPASAREGMSTDLPPVRDAETIRVASFNIQVFGESKLQNARAMQTLAAIARRFDLVAIQEVRANSQDILPRFVDYINADGRRFDYAIGPRLGRTNSKEQYAFVYDTASIEIDRSSLYTVGDPDDQLHREPLVAGFRARAAPPELAFTFALVNLHTDPDEVSREIEAVDDLYRAVRDDGRNEDDVIVLGDFNADDRLLSTALQSSGLRWVISGLATNTRGTDQYDNLIFSLSATSEFTGRGGVFNFAQEFQLTVDEALDVSDHLPVWAEFSVYEGGQPGRLARQPDDRRTLAAPSGYGPSSYGPAGYAPSGFGQPGYTQPGYAQPGYAQPGNAPPGYGQPGLGQAGYGQPNYGQPDYGRRY